MEASIKAILNQTLPASEVLIIDDGSTDNSVEIIKKIIAVYPTARLLCNERNIGIIPTLNRGLKEAKGKYVFFGAADDVIMPRLFEKSIKILNNYPDAALCSSLTYFVEREEDAKILRTALPLRQEGYISPRGVQRKQLNMGNWIQSNVTLYKREALIEIGGFKEDLLSYTDSFSNLLLSLKHGCCFIPEALGVWRRLQSGYSSSINANLPLKIKVMKTAGFYMQSDYQAYFSKSFISNWKKKFLYGAIHDIAFSAMTECKMAIKDSQENNFCKKFIIFALNSSFLIFKYCMIVALRPRDLFFRFSCYVNSVYAMRP